MTVTHQRDVVSIHFGPTIRRTDILFHFTTRNFAYEFEIYYEILLLTYVVVVCRPISRIGNTSHVCSKKVIQMIKAD